MLELLIGLGNPDPGLLLPSRIATKTETATLLSEWKALLFGSEFRDSGHTMRWPSGEEISVCVGGIPTNEDYAQLDAALSRLSELIPLGFRYAQESCDVSIWFISRSEFITSNFPVFSDSQLSNDGLFNVQHRGGWVHTATILLSADLPQSERNHLIWEETVQSIGGVMNDVDNHHTSLFYGRWQGVHGATELVGQDALAVQCNYQIDAGTNQDQYETLAPYWCGAGDEK